MAQRVLVVDDEPSILSTTAALMSDMGFEVIQLQDVRRIRETIATQRVDVLLQDIRIPGFDVEALIQELRSDPATAHVPIVLFSASMDAWEIADRAGVKHVLEKPFRPHEIADVLRAALG